VTACKHGTCICTHENHHLWISLYPAIVKSSQSALQCVCVF